MESKIKKVEISKQIKKKKSSQKASQNKKTTKNSSKKTEKKLLFPQIYNKFTCFPKELNENLLEKDDNDLNNVINNLKHPQKEKFYENFRQMHLLTLNQNDMISSLFMKLFQKELNFNNKICLKNISNLNETLGSFKKEVIKYEGNNNEIFDENENLTTYSQDHM